MGPNACNSKNGYKSIQFQLLIFISDIFNNTKSPAIVNTVPYPFKFNDPYHLLPATQSATNGHIDMTRLHVVKVLILCFLARTALIISEDEEIFRAKKFMEFGVDIDFIDALPDRDGMARAVKAILDYPNSANIIEGGKPENMPAADLGALGFCIVP